MSIPEISSRARLIAFLKKFFATLNAKWQAPSLLPFGYAASISAPFGGKRCFTVDGVTSSIPGSGTGDGYRMMTSGSIVGISCQFDCTAHTSDTEFRVTARSNGSNISAINATVTVTGTGTFGCDATFAAASNIVPGQRLVVLISHGAAGITTENHAALLRIVSSTD
jgi:hypothetical protein